MHRSQNFLIFLFCLSFCGLGQAQQPAPDFSATNLATSPKAPENAAVPLIREAYQLESKQQSDAALVKLNAALQIDPKNLAAYSLRGQIYSEKKLWDKANQDYQEVLTLSPKNILAQFNITELKFMQKLYDAARPGFVDLETSEVGDLASYKVFLCDLLGGHDDVAAKELAVFNAVESKPSYFYSNAAWNLVHHKPEDARGWLVSAERIYSPMKNNLYRSSLKELGYLPLPPPPAK